MGARRLKRTKRRRRERPQRGHSREVSFLLLRGALSLGLRVAKKGVMSETRRSHQPARIVDWQSWPRVKRLARRIPARLLGALIGVSGGSWSFGIRFKERAKKN